MESKKMTFEECYAKVLEAATEYYKAVDEAKTCGFNVVSELTNDHSYVEYFTLSKRLSHDG